MDLDIVGGLRREAAVCASDDILPSNQFSVPDEAVPSGLPRLEDGAIFVSITDISPLPVNECPLVRYFIV